MVRDGGMPLTKTGATNYHAKLRLPNKSRVIKGLVVERVCDHIIMHSN